MPAMNKKHTTLASRLLCSTSLCLALLPVAVHTAEPARKQLPTVTVEADREASTGYKTEALFSPKYTQPLLDTPQSVTVIPSEVIADRGATNLREVMRNVTGITLSAGEGGTPNGDNVNIRGFNARTDIFIDGVRDIGGYFRDPFNVDQVEVIKGPSSVYSGRGSTGGIINQVSKMPEREFFSGGSLSVGTDRLQRITADVNQPINDRSGVRLNAMAHAQEVAGRDEVEYERWGIAPSLAFGQGTDTRLTLTYLHQQENNLPDYGHPYFNGRPVDVPRENFYGLVNRDYEDTMVDVLTAKVEHDFSDSLTLRNNTRYGRAAKDIIVTPPRTPNPVTNTLVRNGRDRDSVDAILLNQTDLVKDFSTGGVDHTLVTGVEIGRETSENKDRVISTMNTTLFNPNSHEAFTGTIVPGSKTETKANSQAAYIFDTAKLNEQWEVNGGLRWDRFNAETTSDATPPTRFERTDTMFSWRGGVVYKPLENGSIYAAYGTSFNPSAEAITLNADNAVLDPEESLTYELGTKWDLLNDRVNLTAAVFRTEKTNARTEDPITEIVTLEGEQRVDGIELGITGQVTEAWRVFAGYAYLTSEIEESSDPAEVGKDVNRTPNHTFTLWNTWQVAPKVEIGGGALYVDESFANTENTNKVPSYVLFDAMASYEITENVALRLNLLNIADEEYYESAYSGHAIPGQGRTAMLTTSFRF